MLNARAGSRITDAGVELAMYAANSQIEASALLMRDVPALNTLTEYVNHFRSELSCAGWYLYEKKDSFGIATRFENGKPKKTLCVLIRFF